MSHQTGMKNAQAVRQAYLDRGLPLTKPGADGMPSDSRLALDATDGGEGAVEVLPSLTNGLAAGPGRPHHLPRWRHHGQRDLRGRRGVGAGAPGSCPPPRISVTTRRRWRSGRRPSTCRKRTDAPVAGRLDPQPGPQRLCHWRHRRGGWPGRRSPVSGRPHRTTGFSESERRACVRETRRQNIHFVGIGGAGANAIAEVLHTQGYGVSGSDQSDRSVTRRLASLGIRIHIGHRPRTSRARTRS